MYRSEFWKKWSKIVFSGHDRLMYSWTNSACSNQALHGGFLGLQLTWAMNKSWSLPGVDLSIVFKSRSLGSFPWFSFLYLPSYNMSTNIYKCKPPWLVFYNFGGFELSDLYACKVNNLPTGMFSSLKPNFWLFYAIWNKKVKLIRGILLITFYLLHNFW